MAVSVGSYAQSYKFLTTDDGLSNSLISKIVQDEDGFVWIATEDGLNCFDGNRIKVYRHSDSDSNSLAHNNIRDIFIDSRGRLFVGTYKSIQVYNPMEDNFSKPARRADGSVFNLSVMSFMEKSDGTVLALGDSPCSVSIDDAGNVKVKSYILPQRTDVHPIDYLVEAPNGSIFVSDNRGGLIRTDENSVHNFTGSVVPSTLFKNKDGIILACSDKNDVLRYNAEADSFECLVQGGGNNSIPFYTYTWYGTDKLLAGTDGNGLKIINIEDKSVSHFSMAEPVLDDSKLKVHAIFIDKSGNIWLGLYQKGILILNSEKSVFNYIGHKSAVDDIIGQSCVSALCFCNGHLWVATDNDGIYVVDLENKRTLKHIIGDDFPKLLLSLFSQDDKNVYVGTYGTGLWKIDAKSFQYKRIPLADPDNRLHFSKISQITSMDNLILVSSMGSGIGFVDAKTDKQVFFKNMVNNTNLWASCVERTSENSFAIGSYNGLYVVENFNRKPVFKHTFDRTIIYDLLAIDQKRLAAATSDGLIITKINDSTGNYDSFRIKGASTNAFYSLTKDSLNNIWAGTDDGLFKITLFDNDEYKITGFSTSDGTVNEEFTTKSVCRSNDGRLFFGGFDGVTYFKADDTRKFMVADSGVRVTRFWVRDHEIKAKDPLLDKPIINEPARRAKVYTLQYNQNSFSIEFSPVDFFSMPDRQYYYSVNNEEPCKIAQNSRRLSFVRLPPDDYTISIFSRTNGEDSPKYTIYVKIYPAWYNSTLAKILYALFGLAIIGGIILLIYRYFENKQEINKHLQIQETNQAKLRFFTNVIHEIRTPMMLIVSPLQKLAALNGDPRLKNELRTICLGVERMHKLVDSLLDMRKIDNGKMTLNLAEHQLAPIITSNIEFFELKASSKNVKLIFTDNLPEDFTLVTDDTAVEKIITNLLSNALKFSSEGGTIEIVTQLAGDAVKITVTDCGPGIAKEDITKIFDRFYQADSPYIQQGTGIGLHFAKALSELLQGSLTAKNRTDQHGAIFTLIHPLNLVAGKESATKIANPSEETDVTKIHEIAGDIPQKKTTYKSAPSKKRVFIVEDDPDVAEYLISELRSDYAITHFNSGETALPDILSFQPDLVITDLMMPELDGFALCKRIKQNININEIPVVIISAKSGDDVEISSLQIGADAFIPKPFNIDVLKQTVKNLINQRHKLIVNYSGSQVQSETADVIDPEEKLLKRIVKAIENNISNVEYSTEMLAADVGLSRVHLYRKLKDLTNQTGSEFIRNIRLKRASELIATRKGFSIAEIADMVGFSNAAYFCTAFRNFFGTSPTGWREMHQNNGNNNSDTEQNTYSEANSANDKDNRKEETSEQ